MSSKNVRLSVLATALLAATAAVSVTQATGDSATAPGASTPAAKATTYLDKTKAALASSGMTVDTISLAVTTGGYDVYAVKGPSVVCLLATATVPIAGYGNQLNCTSRASAEQASTPMSTQLMTSRGLADVAWRPDGATAVQATVGKSAAETITSGNVAMVIRPNGEAGSLSWKTAAGERSTVALPSAAAAKEQAASAG